MQCSWERERDRERERERERQRERERERVEDQRKERIQKKLIRGQEGEVLPKLCQTIMFFF